MKRFEQRRKSPRGNDLLLLCQQWRRDSADNNNNNRQQSLATIAKDDIILSPPFIAAIGRNESILWPNRPSPEINYIVHSMRFDIISDGQTSGALFGPPFPWNTENCFISAEIHFYLILHFGKSQKITSLHATITWFLREFSPAFCLSVVRVRLFPPLKWQMSNGSHSMYRQIGLVNEWSK